MKNQLKLAAFALLLTLPPQSATLFAQGSLTPPGGPAPMMKTLAQVEPRTAITNTGPLTISQPGSYYLTTNILGISGSYGMVIASDNVVLDLNGFALLGVAGSASGIYFNARTNITVRNGTVRGWGGSGVESWSKSLQLENLNVSANGSDGIWASGVCSVQDCAAASNSNNGIKIIAGGIVSRCAVWGNGSDGINAKYSTIENCRAQNNNSIGFNVNYSKAENCLAQANTSFGFRPIYSAVHGCLSISNSSHGFYPEFSSVRECQAQFNASCGINAYRGSAVTGCLVTSNALSGIYAEYPGNLIVGNTCYGNNTSSNTSHAGIYVFEANNRVEDNQVHANSYAGIAVYTGRSGSVIIKNTVSGSGANNYILGVSQAFGPLITTLGAITNLNPWANFSF